MERLQEELGHVAAAGHFKKGDVGYRSDYEHILCLHVYLNNLADAKIAPKLSFFETTCFILFLFIDLIYFLRLHSSFTDEVDQ